MVSIRPEEIRRRRVIGGTGNLPKTLFGFPIADGHRRRLRVESTHSRLVDVQHAPGGQPRPSEANELTAAKPSFTFGNSTTLLRGVACSIELGRLQASKPVARHHRNVRLPTSRAENIVITTNVPWPTTPEKFNPESVGTADTAIDALPIRVTPLQIICAVQAFVEVDCQNRDASNSRRGRFRSQRQQTNHLDFLRRSQSHRLPAGQLGSVDGLPRLPISRRYQPLSHRVNSPIEFVYRRGRLHP